MTNDVKGALDTIKRNLKSPKDKLDRMVLCSAIKRVEDHLTAPSEPVGTLKPWETEEFKARQKEACQTIVETAQKQLEQPADTGELNETGKRFALDYWQSVPDIFGQGYKNVQDLIVQWNNYLKNQGYFTAKPVDVEIQKSSEWENEKNANRDYVEDFPHENGNYQNQCLNCNKIFLGHKRRRICKKCGGKR